MDDPDPNNEESIDDLTQVLTVTARKLANMTLGRKLSGQLKRSIQDKKKASICAACGLKGRWAGDPECEVSGNVDGKATTSSCSITPSKGKSKGQKGQWSRGSQQCEKSDDPSPQQRIRQHH